MFVGAALGESWPVTFVYAAHGLGAPRSGGRGAQGVAPFKQIVRSMLLSCTTSAFSRSFASGDITQLEFLDHAARTLACDGVVLDIRQFPRTDIEYLAQVKKMAADLGLCIAAIYDRDFFSNNAQRMGASLALAGATGAPLLSAPLALETAFPWSEQLAKLGDATGLAKRANVTLALRNAPGTFAATSHDCKRVTKEADSAWLRFGFEPAAFDGASDLASLESKRVMVWRSIDEPVPAEGDASIGFVALDRADGSCTLEEMQRALQLWRRARASFELNRT